MTEKPAKEPIEKEKEKRGALPHQETR